MSISKDSISEDVIENINCKNFYFVQIGANDGIDVDPIREWIIKYNWSGLMFEPQRNIYKKLFSLYEDNKKIKCINAGIAIDRGSYKLYKHALGHGGSSLLTTSRYISVDNYEEIYCYSFKDVIDILNKDNVKTINLLVIDTEGYDSEILKSINFDDIEIRNIWFEKWPDNLEKDIQMIYDKFIPMGYSFKEYETDFFLSKDIKGT